MIIKRAQSSRYDDMSTRIMKICDKLIVKPLIILSQNSIKLSHYPDVSKKVNVTSVYKQNDKLIQKY